MSQPAPRPTRSRRQTIVMDVLGTALVVLVFAGIFAIGSSNPMLDRFFTHEPDQVSCPSPPASGESQSPNADRHVVVDSNGSLVNKSIEGGDSIILVKGVKGVTFFDALWDQKMNYIIYTQGTAEGDAPTDIWRVRPDGTDAKQLTTLKSYEWASYIRLSSDGRAIYFVLQKSDRDELSSISINGGQVKRITSVMYPKEIQNVTISDDGRFVSFTKLQDHVIERQSMTVSANGYDLRDISGSCPPPPSP